MTDFALRVDVVFALPSRTWRESVELTQGRTTVCDAVKASGLDKVCERETGQPPSGYGIYGRKVRPTATLIEGQRVELYRPLVIDPRARRRARGNQ